MIADGAVGSSASVAAIDVWYANRRAVGSEGALGALQEVGQVQLHANVGAPEHSWPHRVASQRPSHLLVKRTFPEFVLARTVGFIVHCAPSLDVSLALQCTRPPGRRCGARVGILSVGVSSVSKTLSPVHVLLKAFFSVLRDEAWATSRCLACKESGQHRGNRFRRR